LPANLLEQAGAHGIVAAQRLNLLRIAGPLVAELIVKPICVSRARQPFYAQVKEIRARPDSAVLRDYTHARSGGASPPQPRASFALNLLMDPDCDFVTLIARPARAKP